jgi:ABC-type uncharacterized transport system substrate-binding protein
MMKRRELIAGFGSVVAWRPLWARADLQSPVIGFLFAFDLSSPGAHPYLAAFRRGLAENGFIEGKNLTVEYRDANGHYDQLPSIATDLARLEPALIVAAQLPAALAAKAATSTIPVLFSAGDDPVKTGLVAAINRPGGNATGVNPIVTSLDEKRLALLNELAPTAKQIGVLINPTLSDVRSHVSSLEEAGRSLGLQLFFANASNEKDFDHAFALFREHGPTTVLIGAEPLFSSKVSRLVALAAQHKLPAMYSLRLDAVAGGLISYGLNLLDSYRILGVYAARVLNGEKPGEMPVWQTVNFERVINLRTAKALRLDVPPSLLARADEVIE